MTTEGPSPELSLSEFQEFTAVTRNRSLDNDWKLDYSKFILDEQIEFLVQHGPGASVLSPFYGRQYIEVPDSTRLGMADEMGDLIWFNVDTADRLGYSVDEICDEAIDSLGENKIKKSNTFADLGNAAMSLAKRIVVPNKLGLMYPDEPAGYTSVEDNPFYVFMRSSHRLQRSLDGGVNDMSPPTASELEEVMPINETIGFNMLVLSYIAKARLGIDIDDIAKFTVKKLSNRITNGKENDIHFDETFIQTV